VLSQKHLINAFLQKELNYNGFKMKQRNCMDSSNPIIKRVYDSLYNFIKEKSKIHNNEIMEKIEFKPQG